MIGSSFGRGFRAQCGRVALVADCVIALFMLCVPRSRMSDPASAMSSPASAQEPQKNSKAKLMIMFSALSLYSLPIARLIWGTPTPVGLIMRYLAIRCAQAVLLLWGVSIITFAFVAMSPGDFFQEMRLNPQISENTIYRFRTQYGLSKPFLIRYSDWLQSVGHGDLGYSFAYGSSVAPLLRVRARNTLFLTVTATFLAWLSALSLGICCAQWHGGWMDRVCLLGTSTLLLIPELLLGLCFLALAVRTGWFRTGGMVSPGFEDLSSWNQAEDLTAHLFLPALVLSLGSFPVLFRHVRTAMLEVLDSPFIRAARGHGISRSRILFRHALPVALNPIVSLFGLSLASLLSISLLTEVIMSWPGLGPLLLEAVLARDINVVIGATMFSVLFLLMGSAAADLLLYASDSRIHSGGLK
jgi:peptide/nickel transport system permease protein